jgi:hypothetical protein
MTVDIDKLLEKASHGELLDEPEIKIICLLAQDILAAEENVKRVQAPIICAGDVHGQFHDLIELFKVGGVPPDTNYIFLGDYVDRGA